MKRILAAIIIGFVFWYGGAVLAEDKEKSIFEINPVVLDAKDSSGATVGLEYKLNGTLWKKNLSSGDAGSSSLDPNAPIGMINIGYKGSGTLAADKERNPKNFLDFLLDAKGKYSASFGSAAFGIFGKYEADQSFENKQGVYGAKLTYVKYGLLGQNDWIGIDGNYGRVDPVEDKERQAALGTTSLDPYYRWDAELVYQIPLKWNKFQELEFDYRYFREVNPSAAIKAAGLETHHLSTVRLGMQNDLYVAYSAGKLPFDKKNEQIFEIGFSYKLQ